MHTKLMFAIKLSMEKQIKDFWAAGFSDLPAINATVFSNALFFQTTTPNFCTVAAVCVCRKRNLICTNLALFLELET